MVFFFNDTATTEIYTLSLHDALPIFVATFADGVTFVGLAAVRDPRLVVATISAALGVREAGGRPLADSLVADRKSTRLNSSHANISYAVFCFKKNKRLCCTLCLLPTP